MVNNNKYSTFSGKSPCIAFFQASCYDSKSSRQEFSELKILSLSEQNQLRFVRSVNRNRTKALIIKECALGISFT